MFRHLRQRRRKQLTRGQSIELGKAHDQRSPLIGVDMVWTAVLDNRSGEVNTLNADFEDNRTAPHPLIVLSEIAPMLNHGFEMDWALKGTRRSNRFRPHGREPGKCKLLVHMPIAAKLLSVRHGIGPCR